MIPNSVSVHSQLPHLLLFFFLLLSIAVCNPLCNAAQIPVNDAYWLTLHISYQRKWPFEKGLWTRRQIHFPWQGNHYHLSQIGASERECGEDGHEKRYQHFENKFTVVVPKCLHFSLGSTVTFLDPSRGRITSPTDGSQGFFCFRATWSSVIRSLTAPFCKNRTEKRNGGLLYTSSNVVFEAEA